MEGTGCGKIVGCSGVQQSVGSVFPSCSFTWGQTLLGLMVIMAISFKRIYASMPWLPGLLQSVPLTPQQATVNPCLHQRLWDMHRQVWLSLDESLLLSWVLVCTWFFCVLQESVSPVLWMFCNQSHWSSKSNSWEFSIHSLDPMVEKMIVVLRSFCSSVRISLI